MGGVDKVVDEDVFARQQRMVEEQIAYRGVKIKRGVGGDGDGAATCLFEKIGRIVITTCTYWFGQVISQPYIVAFMTELLSWQGHFAGEELVQVIRRRYLQDLLTSIYDKS